jgi:hypothetical protein
LVQALYAQLPAPAPPVLLAYFPLVGMGQFVGLHPAALVPPLVV